MKKKENLTWLQKEYPDHFHDGLFWFYEDEWEAIKKAHDEKLKKRKK